MSKQGAAGKRKHVILMFT